MIDKRKVIKLILIITLIIIIIFAAIQIRKTLARYETTTTTDGNVDVAFWVVDNSFKSERLVIDDIYPKDTSYEYTFTVSNYTTGILGDKIAETDMEYDIILTATTNLPLTYTLVKNGTTCTDFKQELIEDEDGTIYRKMRFGTAEQEYPLVMDTIVENSAGKYEKTKITDTYVLKVDFPLQSYVNGDLADNTANLNYPDLIENIQINLTARQKID